MAGGASGAAPASDDWLRACRSRAQLLDGGASSEVAVVRHLLAVQAQDPRAASLAVRARCAGARAAARARAKGEVRSVVTGWLCRGTLHLVCTDDYHWLLALCAPARLAGNRRRLGQEGVSPAAADRAVALIAAALAADGPLRRSELAVLLEAAGIPAAGQAIVHLMMSCALRGVAVVGPRHDDESTLAFAHDWLGPPPAPVDRDAALAELARRYLVGHGPAAPADLAAWAGLGLRDARRGFARASPADAGGGLFALGQPAGGRPVGARLLPAFDPYLLGWKDRGFAVAVADQTRVHPGGGILRAVATSRGLVVGTWGARRPDAGLQVRLDPFGALAPEVADELAAEAADIARFEGLARADLVLAPAGD